MSLFDLIKDSDPFLLPRNTMAVLRYGWRRKDSRRDAPPAALELLHSLARTNIYPIFVEAEGDWTPQAISALLAQYGVRMFGTYTFRDDLVFYVRIGQANFAEYLLQRAGVPLKYGVLSRRIGKRRRPPRPAARNEGRNSLASEFKQMVDELWEDLGSFFQA